MFTWKISELHFDLTKFPGHSESKSWANDETLLCYQISQLKMVFFLTPAPEKLECLSMSQLNLTLIE